MGLYKVKFTLRISSPKYTGQLCILGNQDMVLEHGQNDNVARGTDREIAGAE